MKLHGMVDSQRVATRRAVTPSMHPHGPTCSSFADEATGITLPQTTAYEEIKAPGSIRNKRSGSWIALEIKGICKVLRRIRRRSSWGILIMAHVHRSANGQRNCTKWDHLPVVLAAPSDLLSRPIRRASNSRRVLASSSASNFSSGSTVWYSAANTLLGKPSKA